MGIALGIVSVQAPHDTNNKALCMILAAWSGSVQESFHFRSSRCVRSVPLGASIAACDQLDGWA